MSDVAGKDQDSRTRVLEALRGKLITWTELKEATGLSDQTLSSTLKSLIHDNLLVHPGKRSKYAHVEDIDLLEGEVKGIVQRLHKQRIITLINRMRTDESEKIEDAARARNEFIALYVEWWNKTIEPVKKQQIEKQLIAMDPVTNKDRYTPEEAEMIYKTYHKKSEQRVRQDAEMLANKLENEKGEELKMKVATALSCKDESCAYNLNFD